MKTNIPLLLFFTVLTTLSATAFGQKKDSLVSTNPEKGFRYIAVTAGLSIPMENYRSNFDEQIFPARTGYTFNVETAYRLKKKLSISACIGSFINPLNKKKFKDSLYLPSMETMKYSTSSKKWSNLYLLIGPSFEAVRTSKISIDLRFRIGMTYTHKPAFTKTYTSYYDINNLAISPALSYPLINSTQDSLVNSAATGSLSFAYSLGGAIRYTLNEKWALQLNTDILFANPKFGSYTNPMTVVTTSVGLAYHLRK